MPFTNKHLSLGSWLSIGNTYVAEIMVNAGFDWLVVDMEHSAANDLAQVQRLIQVIDLSGCVPLVRVSDNNPTVIKQVMDAGAHGVIVPLVNTVEDARSAVDSVYYPPRGKRGVGLWRAQSYGIAFQEYRDWLEERALTIVQIEHISAVKNLREILEVEGIDGFIIGPYDLSASLGVVGDLDHNLMVEAMQQVEAVAKTTDKLMGMHIVHLDHNELSRAISTGYNFIAYGADFIFLAESIDAEMAYLNRELLGERKDITK